VKAKLPNSKSHDLITAARLSCESSRKRIRGQQQHHHLHKLCTFTPAFLDILVTILATVLCSAQSDNGSVCMQLLLSVCCLTLFVHLTCSKSLDHSVTLTHVHIVPHNSTARPDRRTSHRKHKSPAASTSYHSAGFSLYHSALGLHQLLPCLHLAIS